jgi:hypothetical protein
MPNSSNTQQCQSRRRPGSVAGRLTRSPRGVRYSGGPVAGHKFPGPSAGRQTGGPVAGHKFPGPSAGRGLILVHAGAVA